MRKFLKQVLMNECEKSTRFCLLWEKFLKTLTHADLTDYTTAIFLLFSKHFDTTLALHTHHPHSLNPTHILHTLRATLVLLLNFCSHKIFQNLKISFEILVLKQKNFPLTQHATWKVWKELKVRCQNFSIQGT